MDTCPLPSAFPRFCRRLRTLVPAVVLAVVSSVTPPVSAGPVPRPGTIAIDSHFGLFQAGSPRPPDSVGVDPTVVFQSAAGWMNRGFAQSGTTLDLDNWVKWVQSMSMEPVVTLQSIAPGDTISSTPTDTTAWKAWVTSLVERYDGDGIDDLPGLTAPVRYWHVEQEWHIWWRGTVEEYLAHLAMTYATVHAADAAAQVILIGIATQTATAGAVCMQSEEGGTSCTVSGEAVDEATQMLRDGQYDVVDMHSYESWPIIAGKVAWIRSIARDPNVPIWALEAGGPSGYDGRATSDAMNAAAVVQQFAQALGNGVERYSWALFPPAPGSQWDYAPWTTMPLTAWKTYPDSLSLKPAYYTYRLLARMIGGFSAVDDRGGSSLTDTLGVFQYRFQMGDSVVYVVWNSDSLPRQVEFHIQGTAALVTHIITEPGVTDDQAFVETVWPLTGSVVYSVSPTPVFFKFVEAVSTDAPGLLPPPDRGHAPWTLDIRSSLVGEVVRFRVHAARTAEAPPRAVVYDARGRQARDVTASLRAADGEGSAFDGQWDGRTEDGVPAASGVYFLAIVPRSPMAAQPAVVARLVRITH